MIDLGRRSVSTLLALGHRCAVAARATGAAAPGRPRTTTSARGAAWVLVLRRLGCVAALLRTTSSGGPAAAWVGCPRRCVAPARRARRRAGRRRAVVAAVSAAPRLGVRTRAARRSRSPAGTGPGRPSAEPRQRVVVRPATPCGGSRSSGSGRAATDQDGGRARRTAPTARNRAVIGPDPDLIRPGQRLAAPPARHRPSPTTTPTGDPMTASSPAPPSPVPMASVQGTLALDYGSDVRATPLPDLRLVPGRPRRARGLRAPVRQRRRRGDRRRPRSEPAAALDHRAGLRRPAAPVRAARAHHARTTAAYGGCAARCAACTCSARRPRPPRSACTSATASAPAPSRRGSSWSTAAGAAPPSSSAELSRRGARSGPWGRPGRRGTSCTSCPSHRGTGRCG